MVAKYDICEKVDFSSSSVCSSSSSSSSSSYSSALTAFSSCKLSIWFIFAAFLNSRSLSQRFAFITSPTICRCAIMLSLLSAFVCKIFNGSSRIRVLKSHYINFCFTANGIVLVYERLFEPPFFFILVLGSLFSLSCMRWKAFAFCMKFIVSHISDSFYRKRFANQRWKYSIIST